jgi:release factor glutamine methyltransferase
MKLKDGITQAMQMLAQEPIGSPRMAAEALMMFVLGRDRAYLLAHPEHELSGESAKTYLDAVAQRASGRPLQYITGHQEFWGLDFIVTPAVLIPRPETEHLVEKALELVRASAVARPRIVDVGTGSGCIALALASELPQAEIHAVDISELALNVARQNVGLLKLADKVQFRESDLLSLFASQPESFDFVVSNPPYVGHKEWEKVQREVREHEPEVAVFAGEDGIEIYRKLIPQAKGVLKPGGWLLMEIGYSMESAVLDLLQNWSEVGSVPDLQGIPRVIVARK